MTTSREDQIAAIFGVNASEYRELDKLGQLIVQAALAVASDERMFLQAAESVARNAQRGHDVTLAAIEAGTHTTAGPQYSLGDVVNRYAEYSTRLHLGWQNLATLSEARKAMLADKSA